MDASGEDLASSDAAAVDAALTAGDPATAVRLARQAIALAPRCPAIWFGLGAARESQYRGARSIDEAVETYRDALAAFDMALLRDPADCRGAALRLARLGIGDPLAAMSPDHVRALFDDEEARIERRPAPFHDALRRAAGELGRQALFAHALDLGCGTGLGAETVRPQCAHLAGIDLSPAMLAEARRSGLYDDLAEGDLLDWLAERPDGSADLVLADDVFAYLGELWPVFSETARVLAEGGLFAFTARSHEGRGTILGEDLRYAHAEAHLADLAASHGLRLVLSEARPCEDRGRPVPGLLVVLAR
ncbi:class I SAM-dependent DNA methyltransferase [Enterovirga rhinocerotis]|uniref:Putative TPR repeat methyltransferase n=1 Tax=Enterovirga rhinocerotis TaxID=1339210 RepID=A0A4R7C536_9HYPH|nr:methyltransferase domain-containing protein [Enterovirga rhinocerotis]TDR93271.1 putative TPR repeat methyltransferase [Enterovirga rhinocerotis]